ncbi:MAG: beta-ketoacyl synthase chain length factor [Bacteroidales bacterium]|jgi:3-oxoacyl-(acyl-carrier-protein) synthase|nr:beta-ketoacyl synthase chain length factor [Bacteroidales bacterium]
MKAYIKSFSLISPSPSFEEVLQVSAQIEYNSQYLTCIEPNYKSYINPTLIRRMSRVVKMGVTVALRCLKDAGIENPDAIIAGTGLGCIEDTEKFLNEIIINKEQFLPPTSFIQSTHNTIAGQIALLLKCNSYNYAYVHRNFSFENALLDALMMLHEEENKNILLGGVDEITAVSYEIMKRLGIYKSVEGLTTNVFINPTEGSIAGEGASCLLLSDKKENAIALINGVKTFVNPETSEEINKQINEFLKSHELTPEDIDNIIMGYNSDSRYDVIYNSVEKELFPNKNILYYKHLCGDYFTSSAFAVCMAAYILKIKQISPAIIFKKGNEAVPKHILIYNQFSGQEHSLILLSGC